MIDIPKTPGVYKIFFTDPELIYIGSSVNLRARYNLHRKQLQKGIHHNIHLQRAYTKYGEGALHFEIVEYVERREDLIVREQHYFDVLNPHFNILRNAHSVLGLKHSEEAKAKNRAAHIGNVPANKGKPMSVEQRQYFHNLYTGRPHGHKTRNGMPAWNKGVPPTPEAIAKMRATTIKNGKPRIGSVNMSTEAKARLQEKRLATLRNKTPEQKAEIQTKRLASRQASQNARPPRWSKRYETCVECSTTKSKHVALGLCEACYTRFRRRKN